MAKWIRHLYQPCLPLGKDGKRVTGSAEHIELSRTAASEGMVLLKNDNSFLPLKKKTKVALFGKACVDYVKGGGGSGDVTIKYSRSLYEGLKIKEGEGKVKVFEPLCNYYSDNVKAQYQQGVAPGMTVEPELPAELLEQAAAFADVAVVTICRFSGEAWDRKASLEKNEAMWEAERLFAERQALVYPDTDYCLTEKEKAMLSAVKSKFQKILVVINSGGVIETGWIKNDPQISSALFMWQGGIEGGLAAADILTGDVNPSGKLVDTFAEKLDDYPSSYNFHESNSYVEYTDDIYVGYRYFETIPEASKKVVYPFGYGLSYTTFAIKKECFEKTENGFRVKVNVKNTGKREGKEVVMLYYSAPCGKLGKPKYELASFSKTGLLSPGKSETVELEISRYQMASYDDTGKVHKSAWLLESGEYSFYIGNNIRSLTMLEEKYVQENTEVVLQLTEKLCPSDLKERLLPDGTMEKLPVCEPKNVESVLPRMPNRDTEGKCPIEPGRARYSLMDRKEIMFEDVASGSKTLDQFMEQLSLEQLCNLLGGQKNNGVSNTFGVGNIPEYGVPDVTTADGPAGLRILPHIGVYTTAWPCSTMLACSFNTELAQKIGTAVAMEVKENNIGIWLAPAVNIHRTPMCGRNFEYYSEDPLVAGKIGASVVRGVQSQKIAATVKHFAFNNKETNRKNSDSRVSERAAREIYLKAFEIIVRESDPWCIMTGYNIVNGIHCSESKELINDVLRGEWGFNGVVMTDWWTSGENYLEAKAGNDLKMGNGYPERIMEAYEKGAISKEEIYTAAKNVLLLILKME